MPSVLDSLVQLLALEQIEENLFRGQSQDLGWGTVFGGQVLGQALSAAVQTVPADRPAHSLHAYFLRPGDVKRPIVYDVDRIRDGSSFTTRRVVAIQRRSDLQPRSVVPEERAGARPSGRDARSARAGVASDRRRAHRKARRALAGEAA